jgi:hypothetical protein
MSVKRISTIVTSHGQTETQELQKYVAAVRNVDFSMPILRTLDEIWLGDPHAEARFSAF